MESIPVLSEPCWHAPYATSGPLRDAWTALPDPSPRPSQGLTRATKPGAARGYWLYIMLFEMGLQGKPGSISWMEAWAWSDSQWTVCLLLLLSGETQLMAQQLQVVTLLQYLHLKQTILQPLSCINEQHHQHFYLSMLRELDCPSLLFATLHWATPRFSTTLCLQSHRSGQVRPGPLKWRCADLGHFQDQCQWYYKFWSTQDT